MSLSEKLDVLSKLDNKLNEMVDEGKLENEVEQADMVRENTNMCD